MATTPRIALFHPGSMGASVGASAVAAGCEVCWLGRGRSSASYARAAAAGLVHFDDAHELLRSSQIVLSICPPAAALATAEQVAAYGFNGIYVDANAIAPGTAAAIATIIRRNGANYIDGGLIGPPVSDASNTRLYLSGNKRKRRRRVLRPQSARGG